MINMIPIIIRVLDHESSPPISITRSAFGRTQHILKQELILPIYEATASVAVSKPSAQVRSERNIKISKYILGIRRL